MVLCREVAAAFAGQAGQRCLGLIKLLHVGITTSCSGMPEHARSDHHEGSKGCVAVRPGWAAPGNAASSKGRMLQNPVVAHTGSELRQSADPVEGDTADICRCSCFWGWP